MHASITHVAVDIHDRPRQALLQAQERRNGHGSGRTVHVPTKWVGYDLARGWQKLHLSDRDVSAWHRVAAPKVDRRAPHIVGALNVAVGHV